MHRLMNEPMGGLRGWPEEANVPAIDLYQTDYEVVAKAVQQGLKPGDICISVAGDVLNLRSL
jgi:hypothetical protein